MYAAFGDPVARAAQAGKKQKQKKNQEEGEEKEKLVTPYSMFDKNEMEEKMVRFIPSFISISTFLRNVLFTLLTLGSFLLSFPPR